MNITTIGIDMAKNMFARLRHTFAEAIDLPMFKQSKLALQGDVEEFSGRGVVAKEVGLTHFLKSTVIVMVSTGDIGGAARRYANKIMQDSNLCVVMIDRPDLEAIKQNPASIVDAFKREAHNAMNLKKLDL